MKSLVITFLASVLSLSLLISCGGGVPQETTFYPFKKKITRCSSLEFQDYSNAFNACYIPSNKYYVQESELQECKNAVSNFKRLHRNLNCTIRNDKNNGVLTVGINYLNSLRDLSIYANNDLREDQSKEKCSSSLTSTILKLLKDKKNIHQYALKELQTRKKYVNCVILQEDSLDYSSLESLEYLLKEDLWLDSKVIDSLSLDKK